MFPVAFFTAGNTMRLHPMRRIAPSEEDALTGALEKRLWDSAAPFRAGFGLKAQECFDGAPTGFLGVNFLRFSIVRFTAQPAKPAEQIIALKRQIQTRHRTRDLLLPRPLSGQVNLKEN